MGYVDRNFWGKIKEEILYFWFELRHLNYIRNNIESTVIKQCVDTNLRLFLACSEILA